MEREINELKNQEKNPRFAFYAVLPPQETI